MRVFVPGERGARELFALAASERVQVRRHLTPSCGDEVDCPPGMTDLVFFYGTLMSAFKRHGRSRIDAKLTLRGRGWINAALFDLGIYPAAIPATDSRVWGEVHRMADSDAVLAALDEVEGFRPSRPETSLYRRVETPVTFEEGHVAIAWVYFYNAPLGRAERIDSGDYLEHLKVK